MSKKKPTTHAHTHTNEGLYVGVKQSVWWANVRRLQEWWTSWCNAKFSSWPQKCAAGLSGAQRDPRVCRAHRPKQHWLWAGHCCCLRDITSRKTTTTTKNKSSVHGSARKSAADKSFSSDGAEHHWTVGSDQVTGAEMTTTWTRRGWAQCVPHSPRTDCARAKLWAENETPLLVCLFLKAAVPQIAPTPSPPPPSYLHPTDPSHRDGWLVRQRQ